MAFAFFERGNLPHPAISLSVFLIVEKAVCAAWEILRTGHHAGFNLSAADEDTVTHKLYETLFDRVFDKGVVEGFDRQVFTVLTRESKLRNYDGANLDKMPDLLVGLVGRHVFMQSQDWLFIECKPVDVDHSVGKHYCDKGLIRFVRGDYAWCMTSALMIGYARNGYTILPKLDEALRSRQRILRTGSFPKPCDRSQDCPTNQQVHISEHGRRFKYKETGQAAPPIIVRHLWLKRD